MQRIIHQYYNKSRLFYLLEGLYTYSSDEEYMFSDVLWLDESLKPLCDLLQSNLLVFRTPEFKSFPMPKLDCVVRDKEITVLLSGGKDSAAVARHYIDLGYTVHLYHATGINQSYPDEKYAAKRVADRLGLPLHIDKLQPYGSHRFVEHPMKNIMIADGAIHYCLANGFTPRIATGNFYNSHVDDSEFEVCGGDCIETWDAYRQAVRSVLPDFDIEIPFATNAETFSVLGDHIELFSDATPCMSPYRFREVFKHHNEEKYNIKVMANRCGSCWKCAMEYIWLADNKKVEYNEDFYEHCVGTLIYTIQKESGYMASVQEAWDNYMFYPIENSHADRLLCKGIKYYKGAAEFY